MASPEPTPLICQPEMSTASVVDGLYSSRNSSLPVAVAGLYWISLITTLRVGALRCRDLGGVGVRGDLGAPLL